MQLKQFLLAIHLTRGIGRAAEAKIIYAIANDLASTHYPWSLDEVFSVIECYQQADNIKSSYHLACNQAETMASDFLTYFDDAYPPQLKEIYEPPLILFYVGNLAALRLPNVAVVGTRTATPYGLAVMRHLLPEVVKSGIAVVSGLAKGIDVMAHQITFANSGVPIAVIGTGIDMTYPAQNQALQQQTGQQGLLLSEYPPGTGPQRSHFPARNRIIAGLSSATLVVEAQQKSGSLITANLALQNNREVMVVPGSIFSENSLGANELLRFGAKMVTKSTDIMESIQLFDTI